MWPLVGWPCAWLIVSVAEEEGEGIRSHPEMRYSLIFFLGSLFFYKDYLKISSNNLSIILLMIETTIFILFRDGGEC